MPGEVDGAVKLGVNLDLGAVKKDLNQLRDEISQTSKNAATIYDKASHSVGEYTGKMAKVNEQLIHQSKLVDTLAQQMLQMLSGDITPKSIITLEKELNRAQKELSKFDAEFEKLAAEQQALTSKEMIIGGKTSLTADEINRMQELDKLIIENGNQTELVDNKLQEIRDKLVNLKLNPQLTPEFEMLSNKLTEADAKLTRLSGELSGQEVPTPQAPSAGFSVISERMIILQSAFQKLEPLMRRVSNAAKSIAAHLVGAFRKVAGHITLFNRHLGASNNLVDKFMRRIKNMAINTFIFFQIRKAIRAMFASFANGFKEYAKYDKAFGNSIKQFKDAGTQLSNTFASAFIPLIQALLPYLQQFVNLMTVAADKMSQFIYALSGKTVYTQAKAVDTLSESLEDVKDKADAAKGSLASFDKLNVQSMSKTSDEDKKDYYTQADIDPKILDIVDRLSTMLDPLLDKLSKMKLELQDAFQKVKLNFNLGDWGHLLTPLAELLSKWLSDIDWNPIKLAALRLGATIGEILNSIFADNILADRIGHTIAELINTALSFALGFLVAFDFTQFGTFIGTGINAAVRDLDWTLLSITISAGINGAIDASLALIKTVNFARLGTRIGQALTLTVAGIHFDTLGKTIAEGINQSFRFVQGFLNGYQVGTIATALSNLINSFFTNIDAAEIASTLSESLITIFDELYIFLDELDWEMIGIRIGEFLANIDVTGILNSLGMAVSKLAIGLLELFTSILVKYFEEDPANAAANLATAVLFIINPLLGIIGAMLKESLENPDEITGTWGELGTVIGDWIKVNKNDIIAAVEDAFDYVFGSTSLTGKLLVMMFKEPDKFDELKKQLERTLFPLKGLFDIVVDGWTDRIDEFKEWLPGAIEVTSESWEDAKNDFEIVKDDLGILFGEFKDDTTAKLEKLQANAETLGENISNSLSNNFEIAKTAAGLATQDMSTEWDNFKNNLAILTDEMKTNAEEKWNTLKDNLSTVGTTIKNDFISVFNKIKNGLKTPINGIISLIQGMINLIIDGLNGMGDLINKNLNIKMPDWAPAGVAGKELGFSLPKLSHITIPALAKGAVIPPSMGEFIARLGDNNTDTEIVSPLETMKQAFREVFSELDLSSNATVNVYLEGDADGIFKVVRTENAKWKKQHSGIGAF